MDDDLERTRGDPGLHPVESVKFRPTVRTQSQPDVRLPDELWMTILESHCTFPPEIFHRVMLNLVKNPNVTSSHLFRADIFYDSGDHADHRHGRSGKDDLIKHLKAELQPVTCAISCYELTRTIVRQLIPRNPQLDRPLVQTCHFFQRREENEEVNMVLYIPHVERVEIMPFYHPAVSKLAFTHRWRAPSCGNEPPDAVGTVSISCALFPDNFLSTKVERTALRLLETVHKHGQGQLGGYEKRVLLDQIIPQKRYQDTYTRLKAKYGRQLAEQWVEVTDPGKHVFEDIGIAAFLVELWRDMYTRSDSEGGVDGHTNGGNDKPPFPGFVDIGCGNGILTYILLSEGYSGWGFDARQRKTWSAFPQHIQQHLQQRLLVPEIFLSSSRYLPQNTTWHDGVFKPGTFIISNHADELTAWTPLLAYLNGSSFIAIPCCSHDLAGSRFRAPPTTKAAKAATARGAARLPQQRYDGMMETATAVAIDAEANDRPSDGNGVATVAKHAAESGSLKRTEAQKKMPSAYSTLCSCVSSLAEEVGFEPEKEVLRIPSTRNLCIVGRRRAAVDEADEPCDAAHARRQKVTTIVEKEVGRSVEAVGREWVERAEKLARKPGSGH